VKNYDKDYLISELIRFNNENGRPPSAKDLDRSNSGYPSRKTFSNYFGSFGNALVQAGFEYRGTENSQRKKPLPKGMISFTKNDIQICIEEYIEKYGEVPTLKQIISIPYYPDRNDFRRLFGGYNNALIELGYKPKHITNYSDNELKSEFLRFVEENGRIPTIREFNNNEYPSFWCYQNRFGSWNKAVKHYGFDIFSHKTIDDLKNDIIKLCNLIYVTEGRKIITYSDIEESEFCSGVCAYSNNFKKHLNITLREFILSIGFDMPKCGLGMVYEFDDGEITTSKFEFETSNYLRNINVKYERNIKYKSFIENYKGNKDCDYVIKTDSCLWYVEIAGMMSDSDIMQSYNSSITEKYRLDLLDKISMLESTKISYKILFPTDFKNNPIDKVYSFLN
jgi:hypothetical protein